MTNKIITEAVRAAFAANPDNPALAKLSAAQAVLESALTRGRPSGLAVNANNFHGIKGRGPAGSVVMHTQEAGWSENASFRKYATPEDGFRGHREFLERNPRYARVLRADSFEEAAAAVSAAGYATDPNYAAKLNAIYKKHIAPVIEANPDIARGVTVSQKTLMSSPDHMIGELEVLKTPEAARHIAALKDGSLTGKAKEEALAAAAIMVSKESKKVLENAGVEITSGNLSLGERIGGHTAAEIIKARKETPNITMGELITKGVISKAMADAYVNSFTPEERQKAGIAEGTTTEKITVEHFGEIMNQAQMARKQEIANQSRGQLNERNQANLDLMMNGPRGMDDLFSMIIVMFIGQMFGIDTGPMLQAMYGIGGGADDNQDSYNPTVTSGNSTGTYSSTNTGEYTRAGNSSVYKRLAGDENNSMPAARGTTNNAGEAYWATLDKNGVLVAGNMVDKRADPMSITKAAALLTIGDMVEKGELSQRFLDRNAGDIMQMMQFSNNAISNSLGAQAAGSKAAFIARLNKMAAERGLTNTNFATIEGLNTGGSHYTTARDMASMMHQLEKDHPELVDRFMVLRKGHTGHKYNGLYGTVAGKTGTGFGDFGIQGANKSFGGIQANGSAYAVLEATRGDIFEAVGVAAKAGMAAPEILRKRDVVPSLTGDMMADLKALPQATYDGRPSPPKYVNLQDYAPIALPDSVKAMANGKGWVAFHIAREWGGNNAYAGEMAFVNITTGEQHRFATRGGGMGIDEHRRNGSTPFAVTMDVHPDPAIQGIYKNLSVERGHAFGTVVRFDPEVKGRDGFLTHRNLRRVGSAGCITYRLEDKERVAQLVEATGVKEIVALDPNIAMVQEEYRKRAEAQAKAQEDAKKATDIISQAAPIPDTVKNQVAAAGISPDAKQAPASEKFVQTSDAANALQKSGVTAAKDDDAKVPSPEVIAQVSASRAAGVAAARA